MANAKPQAAHLRRGQRRFGFSHRLDDRLHERRQIIGLATGDEVAVAHHFGIDVAGTGVDHVVLDGEEARRLPALERLRRAEHPRSMTDGGHDLALLGHRADQAQDRFGAAQEIGSEAARNDEQVEVVG